jgi:hypothetical protein
LGAQKVKEPIEVYVMGRFPHLIWRGSMALVILALLAMALLSVNYSAPVLAQGVVEPTTTPNDPVWRGFVVARAAIEEEFNVNLTTVLRYDWEQQEFSGGIDNCDDDILITDKRPIYFGWSFVITSLRNQQYEARVSFDLKAVTVCDTVITGSAVPTAAPGTTPVASGNLPAPVAGGAAISGFGLGGHVTGLDQAAINAMKAAGMTWVKMQLPMSAGIGKGQEFITSAHNNGFKILLGVVGDKNALASDFNGHLTTYTAFLAELAKAGADAIEVWNEANIDREWPVGQINGANYVKLLAPSYNAIKGANASTIVVSGAPAPTGFFGAAGCGTGGCNDDVFMQQMAQAGAAQYLDCVGLHYNEGIVSPSTNSGDPRGEYPTYYFNSMLNRGYAPFGGKPVCFTEFGYLSPEGFSSPLPGAFGWAANTSVAEHASWLGEAATAAAQSGRVRIAIVWNINFKGFDSDPQAGYAIIRPDGNCPACGILGTVMKP